MSYEYNVRFRRFAAALIDGLILWVITLIINIILSNLFIEASVLTWISYLLVLLLQILYHVMLQFYFGQTIGKALFSIKVVNLSGQKPSLGVFFARELVGKFASSITFGIGFLMILWDRKSQALHDKIADTYVVKA